MVTGPTTYSYANTDPYADSNLRGEATIRSGLESSQNPWATTESYYQHGSPSKGRNEISNPKYTREVRDHVTITGEESHNGVMNQDVISTYDKFLTQNSRPLQQEVSSNSLSQKRDIELKLNRFRSAMQTKGIRGIMSLLQQFRAFDKN